MDSSSTKETSKLSIAISTAILVSILAMILVSYEVLTIPVATAVIPIIAYCLTVAMSFLYQFIACGKINISSVTIGDLGVLAANAIATGILYVESLPLLRYMYGEYADATLPDVASATSVASAASLAQDPEKHYKIQFFSNIVKSALPTNLTSEPMKTGMVYFYWIFWMTLVPHYTLLSLQGMC